MSVKTFALCSDNCNEPKKKNFKKYSDSDYGLLLFGRKRCINKYWRQKMLSSQRKRPIKKSGFFCILAISKAEFSEKKEFTNSPVF